MPVACKKEWFALDKKYFAKLNGYLHIENGINRKRIPGGIVSRRANGEKEDHSRLLFLSFIPARHLSPLRALLNKTNIHFLKKDRITASLFGNILLHQVTIF